MLTISEQYEWCWNLGAYMGQECELCPYKNECNMNKQEDNDSEEEK